MEKGLIWNRFRGALAFSIFNRGFRLLMVLLISILENSVYLLLSTSPSMPMKRTKVVLADDHKLFSDGLKKLLEDSSHFIVLKQFTKGDVLLDGLVELRPTLLVMDIEIIGELNGLEVLRRIRLNDKSLKVVLLSMHEEPVYWREAAEAGADAYLTKSIESAILIQHLIRVVNGEKIFPLQSHTDPTDEDLILSKQERRVVKLIAEGKTSEEIASLLGISGLTVKVHRRNMMKKMGVETSAELISRCFGKGIL
jgi:DNA-binding NarL/FixJ family response regulator